MSSPSFKGKLAAAFNSGNNDRILAATVNGVTISAYVFFALFTIMSFVTSAILIHCGSEDENMGYVGIAVTTLVMGLISAAMMGILLYYIMSARQKTNDSEIRTASDVEDFSDWL